MQRPFLWLEFDCFVGMMKLKHLGCNITKKWGMWVVRSRLLQLYVSTRESFMVMSSLVFVKLWFMHNDHEIIRKKIGFG